MTTERPPLRQRLLEAIARLTARHYGWVLLTAVFLTVASLVSFASKGSGSSFDLARMLPQDVPAARAFTRAVTDFGSADEAVVLFRLRHDGSAAEARAAIQATGRVADRVADRLERHADFKSAFCRRLRPEEQEQLIQRELPRAGLLLLDEAYIERAEALLTPAAIRASVRRTMDKLSTGAADEEAQAMLVMNVLGLGDLFREGLRDLLGATSRTGADAGADAGADGVGERGGKGAPVNPKGYIVSHKKDMMLVVAQPHHPAQSAVIAERIMRALEAVVEEEAAAAPPADRARFTIQYAGGYAAALAYKRYTFHTLAITLLISAVGVMTLFGLFFRRPGVLLLIGVPLFMILAWTAGIGRLIFGQLGTISSAFAAVLLGLGIDYAVHIYNRYIEEREDGAAVEAAFVASLGQTGWGVIIGMVTTCCAFLGLWATRFSELAEFGVLAGLGIFLSVPAMLFVLPALIAWRNAIAPERVQAIAPVGFGLPRVADWVERRHLAITVLSLGLAALCAGWLLLRPETLSFDKRVSVLRPRAEAFELAGEISRAFSNQNPNKLRLLVLGRTEEEALEKAAAKQRALAALRREGLVESYASILSYLPAPSEQRKRLAALGRIDFAAAEAALRDALATEGLDPAAFDFNLRLLRQHAERVRTGRLILPSDFAGTAVARLTDRFVARRRKRYYLKDGVPPEIFPVTLAKDATAKQGAILRHRAGEALTLEQVEALWSPTMERDQRTGSITVYRPGVTVQAILYLPIEAENRTGEPIVTEAWLERAGGALGLDGGSHASATLDGEYEYAVTGVSILAHELAAIVKEDFQRVSLWIVAISAGVLLLFYLRRPWRALYCFVPVGLGMLYLFGFMAILGPPLGIRFNFVNILTIPIIIGVGLDNGIHLVNRYVETGRRMRPMIAETGRALTITALTSMVGFGSLYVGGSTGIQSLGLVSTLALALVLLASIIIFPAVAATFTPATPPSDPPPPPPPPPPSDPAAPPAPPQSS